MFNTIEFWSGKNPITGKSPALVDQKADARHQRSNQHLDPALNKVARPYAACRVREVEMRYPDAHTAQMEIHYLDGRRGTMRGEMHGDLLHLYLDDKLISTLSRQQLDEMSQGRAQALA